LLWQSEKSRLKQLFAPRRVTSLILPLERDSDRE
jgi:hypothetical protein